MRPMLLPALALALPALSPADIILRTDYADLVLDDAGRWKSFLDRQTQEELLSDGGRLPCVRVRLPQGEIEATRASLQGDRLAVDLGEGTGRAEFRVTQRPSHLAFELLSLAPAGAEEVTLTTLMLKPLANMASAPNILYDDRHAIGVMALNLPVNCGSNRHQPSSGTHEGVTQSLKLIQGDAPVGASYAEYAATSTRPQNDGWAYRPQRLRTSLDLSRFAGLALWVKGDGKGELLKVQLHDGRSSALESYKDHYVTIDFTGWKYVELPRGPQDGIDYSHIANVNLYYNGLPGQTAVACGIDDLRAVRELTGKPSTDPQDIVIEGFESLSCPYLDREATELLALCYSKYGVEGSRFCVFAAPRAKLATVVQAIETAEGLPCPQLSGKWGRTSPDIRRSYIMFHDLSEANLDRAIEYTRLANADMIVFLESCWATSTGHFPINEANFPGGIESLKRAVRKVHAAGLKAGLHFLACGITQNDAYITPVPDPRLLKDAQVALAADLDDKQTTVPLAETPTDLFPREDKGYMGRGVDVQIDQEVIRYGGIEGTNLIACTRGAYGTQAAPHAKGALVHHLRRHYGMFLRDVDSPIHDEVADRIASIVNACSFDMTYFDGSEDLQGDHWYYNAKLQYAYWKRYERRDTMLLQGSSYSHLSWHMISRMASADGYADIKQLLDERSPSFETYYRGNFMPLDIGWYGIGLERLSFDDIEYVCSRSIGYDSSIGWSTPVSALDNAPRGREMLEMAGRYEKLRLAGTFDGATKERLRQPGQDVRLVQHGGRWGFVDCVYDPPVAVTDTDGKANAWALPPAPAGRGTGGAASLEAELAVGPALRPGANWDRDDNVVLEDFATLAPYAATPGNDYEKFVIGPGKLGAVKEGVTQSFELTQEHSRTGAAVGKYEAVSTLGDQSGWSAVGKRFPEPLDLSWMAGIGIWVHGDGKGAQFKVQLRDTAGQWNDHYIHMDYTGWRYHELVKPQSGELDRSKVEYLLFYFNGLPGKETSAVYVDTVKALRELSPPLRDLTLTVGDRSLTFPGVFDTGQTILYRGRDGSELLTWGQGRQPLKPEGGELTLPEGDSEARLTTSGVLTRMVTVRTARVYP